ncbi:MAG: hypothetical protein JXR41_07235, partial [Bacteroidales bacterium]|nr:hypothetical protein [Bacteroidales bacterium]
MDRTDAKGGSRNSSLSRLDEQTNIRRSRQLHLSWFMLWMTYIFFVNLHPVQLSGQIKSVGLPFIHNHTREEYNAGTQTWAIAQDKNGIMYFANNAGMLMFDGSKWDLYPLPNNSVVRCVATSENRIYVGGYDELGYFEENATGTLKYHSLISLLPEEEKSFGEIWRIHFTRYGIVYQSFLKIFIFRNDRFEIVAPMSRFGFSYVVDNKVFVVDRENGLYILKNKDLLPYYRNNNFFRENEISFMTSVAADQLIIGTTNNGIFILKGTDLISWPADINRKLKHDQIYTTIELTNGILAVGTIQNGLYVINERGDIIQHLNRFKGLQNNTVLSLFYDRYHNLWLGLDNGIDMLEVSSPLTFINYCYNIESSYCSVVHNGVLYIGTNQGLFAREYEKIENKYTMEKGFELVEGTMGQVWCLKIIDHELFCGHNLGTFIIRENKAHLISDEQGGWDYVRPKTNDDILIGGTYNGLTLYKKSENASFGWVFKGRIARFNESCKEMVMDNDGVLWITHGYKGVFRVILSDNYTQVIDASLYNASDGLPAIPYSVAKIQDKTILVTGESFYQYDRVTNAFKRDERLNYVFNAITGITKVIEDYQGNLWFFTGQSMGVMQMQENGDFIRNVLPFLRIKNQYIASSFENVYVFGKNMAFIGSQRGMIHYNPAVIKDFTIPYKAFIGQVMIKRKGHDSIIHKKGDVNPGSVNAHTFPYRYNSISVSYFSPFFEAPEQMSYSFRLAGYDESWSDWTHKTEKEYTNLHEGDYIFEVRAKNIYENQSETAQYAFSIRPPFYRSRIAWMAYGLFFLALAGLNFLFIRRRIEKTRRLEKLKHKRELIAKEKKYKEEAELSEQEIEKLKNEKLQNEMRHKNMELANSTMHIIQKNKFLHDLKRELLSAYGRSGDNDMRPDIKS